MTQPESVNISKTLNPNFSRRRFFFRLSESFTSRLNQMKLRFHQELFSLHITSQIIKPTLSKTNRSLSSLLGPIKVMESRLKIEHSLWIRRRPNLLSPWRNRLSHVLQWSFLYGRSSQKPCERLNKEWFKKLQIDCCTNYYTYFLCSGPDVGSHTCITYDAVNQAYLDARQRIREYQLFCCWLRFDKG